MHTAMIAPSRLFMSRGITFKEEFFYLFQESKPHTTVTALNDLVPIR